MNFLKSLSLCVGLICFTSQVTAHTLRNGVGYTNINNNIGSVCPLFEVYSDCGPACEPACYNIAYCPPKCVAGCFCLQGLVRGPDGRCILPQQCPAAEPALQNQDNQNLFVIISAPVGSHSARTVGNGLVGLSNINNNLGGVEVISNAGGNIVEVSNAGGNFVEVTDAGNGVEVINTESNVVELSNSNGVNNGCPLFEVYSDCGTPCEPTCPNVNAYCSSHCVAGCFCLQGLVRGPDGSCILPQFCPGGYNTIGYNPANNIGGYNTAGYNTYNNLVGYNTAGYNTANNLLGYNTAGYNTANNLAWVPNAGGNYRGVGYPNNVNNIGGVWVPNNVGNNGNNVVEERIQETEIIDVVGPRG